MSLFRMCIYSYISSFLHDTSRKFFLNRDQCLRRHYIYFLCLLNKFQYIFVPFSFKDFEDLRCLRYPKTSQERRGIVMSTDSQHTVSTYTPCIRVHGCSFFWIHLITIQLLDSIVYNKSSYYISVSYIKYKSLLYSSEIQHSDHF